MTHPPPRLKRWLENGADPNTVDLDGNTRLHRAIIDDEPDSVSLLLHFGANDRLLNPENMSPEALARHLGRTLCLNELGKSYGKLFIGPCEQRRVVELEEQLDFVYTESLVFPDYASFQGIRNLVETALPRESYAMGKEWGDKYKAEIEGGETAPVYISKVSDTVGYGLFARQELPKGALVGQYCGRVSHQSENPTSQYHLNYPIKGHSFVIDAAPCGGYLRFANHSDNPNMEPRLAIKNSIIHVLFFTKKRVDIDAQLLYDYGKGYWKNSQTPQSL